MYLKSSDGSVEISVLVFSNRFIFGFPAGELRKRKINKTRISEDVKQEKQKPRKKDPEENLGNVITTLDTEKIERGVDYAVVKEAIDSILKSKCITVKEMFSDVDIVSRLCEGFEYTLKELISTMVEHEPDTFNLSFIRTVIKPLIAKINEEKKNYEEENEHNKGYRFVFDVL